MAWQALRVTFKEGHAVILELVTSSWFSFDEARASYWIDQLDDGFIYGQALSWFEVYLVIKVSNLNKSCTR